VAIFCDSPWCVVYYDKSNCSWTIFRGRGKLTHCSESEVKLFLQSENMLLKLMTTNWHNWNTKNRKKLVLILMNATNPIHLKFSEGFIVNFKLLMFVSYRFWNIFLSIFIVFNFTDIPGSLLCPVDPCKSRIQ
jgi:hypothetical protein